MAEIDPALVPWNLPWSVRAAIIIGGYMADDLGQVPDGASGLRMALAHSRIRSTNRLIQQAQESRFIISTGHYGPRPQMLFVDVGRLQADACDFCGRRGTPLGRVRRKRGERPRCRSCYQMSREDRGGWRENAIRVWRTCQGLGLTEAQTVYRIANMAHLPLYPRPDSEPGAQSVVPFLVEQGLIHKDWSVFAYRSGSGVVVDD